MKVLQDIVNTPTVQVMVDGVRPLPDNWYAFSTSYKICTSIIYCSVDVPHCSYSAGVYMGSSMQIPVIKVFAGDETKK